MLAVGRCTYVLTLTYLARFQRRGLLAWVLDGAGLDVEHAVYRDGPRAWTTRSWGVGGETSSRQHRESEKGDENTSQSRLSPSRRCLRPGRASLSDVAPWLSDWYQARKGHQCSGLYGFEHKRSRIKTLRDHSTLVDAQASAC